MIRLCRAEDGQAFQVSLSIAKHHDAVEAETVLGQCNPPGYREASNWLRGAFFSPNGRGRLGSLELFINQETGVEQEAILAYLSDGRRLTSANVRELAGSQDQVRERTLSSQIANESLYMQTIFVFNKSLLECNVEEVVQQLTLTAALQPPIEGPGHILLSLHL